MSKCYWVLVASAFAIALLISAGFGFYSASLGYGHCEKQCTESGAKTSSRKQNYPHQVETNRAGLPYLAEFVASNPEPKDSSERERRDLAAQESMSVWAFWMMAFSAVGIVVTSIGTFFLLWQILLTRKAVEDTCEATEAMREANKIARENSEKQLRAYVCVKTARILEDPWSDKLHAIQIQLYNNGSTPAEITNVMLEANWIQETEVNKTIKVINQKGTIDFRIHNDVPTSIPFRFDNSFAKARAHGTMFIAGFVKYKDAFGKSHREVFCFKTSNDEPFFDLDFPETLDAYPLKTAWKKIRKQQRAKPPQKK